MSEFFPPPVPTMAPEQALELGRSWKAMAEHTRTMGDVGGSRLAEQQSQWWLTYAIALAQLAQNKRDEGAWAGTDSAYRGPALPIPEGMGSESAPEGMMRAALQEALQELLEWAERTGGWEAKCWDEARAALAKAKGGPGPQPDQPQPGPAP